MPAQIQRADMSGSVSLENSLYKYCALRNDDNSSHTRGLQILMKGMVIYMNIKRNQLIIDLINILMLFMLAYLFIAIALRSFMADSAIKTLFLLPAPFLSYAIRRSMKHIWSFLLLHAAVLTLYLSVAGHPLLTAAYGVYLVSVTIYAFYQKQRPAEHSSIPPYSVLVILFLYICSYFLHMPDMQRLSFLLAITYILLNVLSMYLSNLSRFARNHADIQNVPFQQIRNSNHVLVMFLCGLFFLAMLVFSYVPLGAIISYLGRMLQRILRMLLSLIHLSEPEASQETAPEDAAPPAYDIVPSESSWLMQLISEIFRWLATILIIAAAIALILYAIYRLYRYFYLKSEAVFQDEVEFISPYAKKEHAPRKVRHSRHWLFGRSNNDTIRKIYAKSVAANSNGITKPSKSMTPDQLSRYALGRTGTDARAEENEEGNSQLLTSHYEKARYSNEECTREEVRSVKELLK